jgi:hypothetical protein
MDLSRPEESWVANEVVRPRPAGLLKKHAAVELAKVEAETRRPE